MPTSSEEMARIHFTSKSRHFRDVQNCISKLLGPFAENHDLSELREIGENVTMKHSLKVLFYPVMCLSDQKQTLQNHCQFMCIGTPFVMCVSDDLSHWFDKKYVDRTESCQTLDKK